MNKQAQRTETILNILKTRQQLTTTEAMELLDVSESTVRRLFGELEQEQKVIRRYGGIQLANKTPGEYSFDRLMESRQDEKEAIAALGINCIQDSDILFFDSGTTLYYLCQALVPKLESEEIRDLTVFTNSLANLQVLSPVCRVILIGGEYRPKRMDFAGYASNKFIGHFNFTKCFIGADGICLEEGLMATDSDTALMAELAIARSEQTIVMTDAGKLGKRSFLSYAPLDKADRIITGWNADPEFLETLRQRGIAVCTAQAVGK